MILSWPTPLPWPPPIDHRSRPSAPATASPFMVLSPMVLSSDFRQNHTGGLLVSQVRACSSPASALNASAVSRCPPEAFSGPDAAFRVFSVFRGGLILATGITSPSSFLLFFAAFFVYYSCMAFKTLTISEEAHARLRKHKMPGESFTQVILRELPEPLETAGEVLDYLKFQPPPRLDPRALRALRQGRGRRSNRK